MKYLNSPCSELGACVYNELSRLERAWLLTIRVFRYFYRVYGGIYKHCTCNTYLGDVAIQLVQIIVASHASHLLCIYLVDHTVLASKLIRPQVILSIDCLS